jgi:2-polyprenyl-3-methyl-5-hydroxy-6-metoxy-1,4-benzoquinol methylase
MVLDFGRGIGNLTEKMAPKADKVMAIDSSAKMISILKDKNVKNVETHHLTLSDGDISEKFDLITASSVFGFVSDFGAALHMMKGLLKPNGTLVQRDWLVRGMMVLVLALIN